MAPIPDISPKDTWAALAADKGAVLIDVRTDAEWNFVGLPDLMALGKQVVNDYRSFEDQCLALASRKFPRLIKPAG